MFRQGQLAVGLAGEGDGEDAQVDDHDHDDVL